MSSKDLWIVIILSVVISLLTILPELSIFFADDEIFSRIYTGSFSDIVAEALTSIVIMSILFISNLLIFKFHRPNQKIGIGKILLSLLFLFVGGTLLRELAERILFAIHYKDVPNAEVLLYHITHPLHDWITSLIIFLTCYAIYLVRKQSMMALEHQQLNTEIFKHQYESLKAQLNPHMLFNSLNALSTLVDESPVKAKDYINELSRVLRYTLQEGECYVVDLEQELSYTQAYIHLQKTRYEDNLNFNIQISDRALRKYLPPMSLQLLIENAIKHNQVSSKKPLEISIYSENDEQLVVSNFLQPKFNGDHIQETGIGLVNLDKRYNLLFNKHIIIEKSSNLFLVRIPLTDPINP